MQRLSKLKLKELQEKIQNERLSKSTDVLIDAVSISVDFDPALTMNCPVKSNTFNNVVTFLVLQSLVLLVVVRVLYRNNLRRSDCKTVFGKRKPRTNQGKLQLLIKRIEEEKVRFKTRSNRRWFNYIKGKIVKIKGHSVSSLCDILSKKKSSNKWINTFIKTVNASQSLETKDLSKSKWAQII